MHQMSTSDSDVDIGFGWLWGRYVGFELRAHHRPQPTRACRPYALIENVVTHADHRNKGYGKAILADALSHAWASGCYKVMLLTGKKDEATLRFYESASFVADEKWGFVAKPPPA